MRSLGAVVIAALLIFGCAGRGKDVSSLPALSGQFSAAECGGLFPSRGWQYLHSIEFTMDNGYGTTVVGITTLESTRIRCALLSIEGFSLFEALFDRDTGLSVLRAVPPFDSTVFAEGLIADIQRIFLRPPGPMQTGLTADNKRICRFTGVEGGTADILVAQQQCPQIRIYSPDGLLQRLITARDCRMHPAGLIPHHLELRRYGSSGYTLKMNLLRADPMT